MSDQTLTRDIRGSRSPGDTSGNQAAAACYAEAYSYSSKHCGAPEKKETPSSLNSIIDVELRLLSEIAKLYDESKKVPGVRQTEDSIAEFFRKISSGNGLDSFTPIMRTAAEMYIKGKNTPAVQELETSLEKLMQNRLDHNFASDLTASLLPTTADIYIKGKDAPVSWAAFDLGEKIIQKMLVDHPEGTAANAAVNFALKGIDIGPELPYVIGAAAIGTAISHSKKLVGDYRDFFVSELQADYQAMRTGGLQKLISRMLDTAKTTGLKGLDEIVPIFMSRSSLSPAQQTKTDNHIDKLESLAEPVIVASVSGPAGESANLTTKQLMGELADLCLPLLKEFMSGGMPELMPAFATAAGAHPPMQIFHEPELPLEPNTYYGGLHGESSGRRMSAGEVATHYAERINNIQRSTGVSTKDIAQFVAARANKYKWTEDTVLNQLEIYAKNFLEIIDQPQYKQQLDRLWDLQGLREIRQLRYDRSDMLRLIWKNDYDLSINNRDVGSQLQAAINEFEKRVVPPNINASLHERATVIPWEAIRNASIRGTERVLNPDELQRYISGVKDYRYHLNTSPPADRAGIERCYRNWYPHQEYRQVAERLYYQYAKENMRNFDPNLPKISLLSASPAPVIDSNSSAFRELINWWKWVWF